MNFDSHPLIIHLFSNGGAYLYQNIDLAVKELETPLDVSSKFKCLSFSIGDAFSFYLTLPHPSSSFFCRFAE